MLLLLLLRVAVAAVAAVLLHVPPALPDPGEDGGVAPDDGDAGEDEAEHHQELLRGGAPLPEQ